MMKLILFLTAEFFILNALTLLKKNDSSISFVKWFGISIVFIMCWNAFLAGVLNLFHLPNGLCPISFITILASGVLFIKVRKTGKQKYHTDSCDWVFFLVMTAVSFLFLFCYFGPSLNARFISVDAAVHTRYAQEFALHHKLVQNLFFSAVNDGLVMEAVQSVVGTERIYHVFPLMRVFDFFLTGMIFYAVVTQKINDEKKKRICCIIISGLYVMGYPLNTELFGFAYYGASTYIIASILFLMNDLDENHKEAVIALNLCLFGAFTSYTMLLPVVYVFVLVSYFIKSVRGKESVQSFMKRMLEIFLIPTLLGMLYAYTNLKEISPSGGISNDGGKYFELYADFILILPFVISDYIHIFKEKIISEHKILGITTFIYWLVFLILTVNGKVSVYYFSKLYNLCWFCAFTAFTDECMRLMNDEKVFVATFLSVDMVLIFLSFWEIRKKPDWNIPGLINHYAESVTAVYDFNYQVLKDEPYFPGENVDIFNYVRGLKRDRVLYCGDGVMAQWYITFTGNEDLYTGNSEEECENLLNQNHYQYICIINNEFSDTHKELFEAGNQIVFSNAKGEIIRVNK